MIIRTIMCIAGLVLASPAAAEPTKVVVRVLSQDAKFIGDGTGGARVTIREAASGKVLAHGITKGGTGNTERIMEASGRSPLVQTADAASFNAIVDVSEPTLVDLEVEGPLGRPNSVVRVRSQRWIITGEAIDAGNGWLVELPGLAITPRSVREGDALSIEAKVELLCGCPITPGGRWDAADYQVKAVLWSGKKRISTTPLTFRTSPGTYASTIPASTAGKLRLTIYAVNIKTGNAGVVHIPAS